MHKNIIFFSLIFFTYFFSSNTLKLIDHAPHRDTRQTFTIAIVATNDLHGSAFPKQYQLSPIMKTKYKSGGLVYFGNMVDTLRQEYGKDKVIYLDAGDQIQGAIQSGPFVSNGTIMKQFFDIMELSASTIGNHQFDFGQTILQNYMKSRKAPFLVANLYDKHGNHSSKILKNSKKSQVLRIGTGQDQIRVGVIGLITNETPLKSLSLKYFKTKFEFKNYTKIVLDEAQNLRKNKKVDVVILVSHIGNKCINASRQFRIWHNTTQQKSCLQTDQVSKLLHSLPSGTVDAVVQGHRHTFSHVWINNVPVAGTPNLGTYFNVIYLQISFKNHKVVNSLIQGPIPICQKLFSQTKNCQYMTASQIKEAGALSRWKFHGKFVQQKKQLKVLFDKWEPQLQKYKSKVCYSEEFIKVDNSQETQSGNLFADLLLSISPNADFSIVSKDNFKIALPPGIITEGHIIQMIPIQQSQLITAQITGLQLRNTIKAIQTGKKYFYPTAGLHQVINTNHKVPKQLLRLTKYSGQVLNEKSTYTLVIPEQLLQYNQDFKYVIKQEIWKIKNKKKLGSLRKLINDQLKKLGVITKNSHFNQKKRRLQLREY